MKTLLLGCGNSRTRKLLYRGLTEEFDELTTIDMNLSCDPDICMQLDGYIKLPFGSETFDEIAAYDFLEHIGQQGDWEGFFREFSEYHRVLKLNGTMGIIVPIGRDAFADPGHKRMFSLNHFMFLSQDFYKESLDKGKSITDYRWFWKNDFKIMAIEESEHHIACLLEKR